MDVTHTGSSMKWRTALMVLHSKKKKNPSEVIAAVIAYRVVFFFLMAPIFKIEYQLGSSVPVH